MTGGFHYNGAIVKIRIQNFMTYDDVTMYPGPNLNMILGPNGTGKSAMVCCIIVGLAGEVSLTGRGSSAADFVKKNREFAITEIELHNNDGPNHIVERKITLDRSKPNKVENEWKLDHTISNQTKVKALMKDLNIKVDNLCQFLPQDSVTQFVKMNTVELLEDTLKAAGDYELVEDHKKLVAKTRDINEAKREFEDLKQSKEEFQVNVQRLETEVQQLQQREQLIEMKKICSQKISYARYLDAKQKLENAKIEVRKIADELKNVERNCEPFRKARDQFEREEFKLDKATQESHKTVATSLDQLRVKQIEFDELKLKCHERESSFRSKETDEKTRNAEIRLKQVELDTLNIKLSEAQDIDCSNQIDAINRECEGYRAQMRTANSKYIRNEDSLGFIVRELDIARKEHASINNVREKRIDILKGRFPDAHKANEWLVKHRHAFSKQVFSPIMCEINVIEPHFSHIVENSIAKNDLCAFVCQSREDVHTLTRVAREELKVKINVILAPEPARDQEFMKPTSAFPKLVNLGIKRFVRDLIDVPVPIKRYLCANNKFHKIPVGEQLPEPKIKALMQMREFPRFYNNRKFYMVNYSRYDGASVMTQAEVRDAQLLKFTLDTSRLREVSAKITDLLDKQKKCQSDRTVFQAELDKYKRSYNEASVRLKSLREKQGEKQAIEQRIFRLSEELQRLKSRRIDLEAEKAKLKNEMTKIGKAMVLAVLNLGDICDNFVSIRQNHMNDLIAKELAQINRRLAAKKLSEAERETQHLKRKMDEHQKCLDVINSAIREARAEAEERIRGFRKGRLDEETTTKFALLEFEDVGLLKSKLIDLTAQIERIQPDSGDLLAEFKNQSRNLAEKKAKIKAIEKVIADHEKIRDQIKDNWRTKLNEVISVIDVNYRDFMQKLNYGGQVKLDFDERDANNFTAYGISIMVRYRDDEELIPLTSTRQSGGERSVATMIYMLALQTKTTVPFRCVDEINQGMDKDNERKVFELLVDTADSSSSQYFLVSPKLLSDLTYSDKMRIHVVFNGKRLKTPLGVAPISNRQDTVKARKKTRVK